MGEMSETGLVLPVSVHPMPAPTTILIAIVAFVMMEPLTAPIHRWVMHGIGEFLHRSPTVQCCNGSKRTTGTR